MIIRLFNIFFLGKKSGIRETDEKRAGYGILAKKARECGIRTPPDSRPCTEQITKKREKKPRAPLRVETIAEGGEPGENSRVRSGRDRLKLIPNSITVGGGKEDHYPHWLL